MELMSQKQTPVGENSAGPENSAAEDGTESRGASVLSNAIDVLRCFTVGEPLQGVTAIAARIGLHKSTVSRILATLELENLVERDPNSRRFKLGLGLIAVTGPLLADLDVRRAAYPILRELTEQTRETSALMLWNGVESICVEQLPSPQQVKHTTALGTRYATAVSSSVQLFLSHEGAERTRTLLASGALTLPAGLDGTEEFLLRLKQVSSQGYAVNYGESSPQEVGVAAPVYDHRGDMAACVMVAAPFFRVSAHSLETLVEACVAAGRLATIRLGGTPTDLAPSAPAD